MKLTTSVISGLALCVVNVAAQDFGSLPNCAVCPSFDLLEIQETGTLTNILDTYRKTAQPTLFPLPAV